MNERWLPVLGWEGIYSVSDQGRVRSEARVVKRRDGRQRNQPEKILTPTQSPNNGRMIVVLCDGPDRHVTFSVDRIVMDTFVGPRPDGLERLHWDDDPTNNALTNLRYGTRSENLHDAVRNGRHAMASRTHCPQKHPYSPENTYIRKGGRNCRECRRQKWRERKARQTQQAAS
jgi:hypothetical protein